MCFIARPPVRETNPPPGRVFFSSAAQDYADFSARVRREISLAMKLFQETPHGRRSDADR